MLRFDTLEALGVRMAALSDRSDGDCGRRAGAPEARAEFVRGCMGCSAKVVIPTQVHGTRVVTVSDNGLRPEEAADAVITATPGVPIGVSVADCVPILLYDPRTLSGGVAHAGREGTQRGMMSAIVGALSTEYGVRPSSLHVVIGPSAGPCCYEVSEELAARFLARGLPARGRYLDLWAANQEQAEAAGVQRGNIRVSGLCTICSGRFFSYRRGDKTERNLATMVL